MTSGNLFFKLTLRDIKRRIWCPVVLMICYLLSMEIVSLISFQGIELKDYMSSELETCLQFFNNTFLTPDRNATLLIVTMGAAIVCGLSSFNYLNNRKQIDLYHSLPIRRTTMFFSRYLAGILCFLIPFLANLLITMGIAMGRNAVNATTVTRVFGMIAFYIIYFVSVYSMVIVAVMLTGNIILNVLGSVVLLFYSQILWLTILVTNSMFFDTFCEDFFKQYVILSPIHDIALGIEKMLKARNSTGYFSYRVVLPNMLIEILVIAVLIGIGCFLYQKRPSEAAGKSMVFPISERIIKLLFLIPVSLLSGAFFRTLATDTQGNAWFLFGSIFGFFLIGFIMEIIFRQDFKLLFCHIKYLFVCFAVLLVVIAVYKFDLIGFDRYMPKEEKIEYMAVSIGNLDMQIAYGQNNRSTTTMTEYRLENMELREFTAAYDLAESAVKNPLISDGEYVPITVKYHLENGRDIYRQYVVDDADEQVSMCINDIYRTQEYKAANFPILNGEDINAYRIDCVSAFEDGSIKVTEELSKEFLDIYKKELSNLTLEQIRTEYPVGSLRFMLKKTDITGYIYTDMLDGYAVYPEFTNTIAWAKEHGYDFTETPADVVVTEISIWDYSGIRKSEEGWRDFAHVVYEDEKHIEEILQSVVAEYDLFNTHYMPVDSVYEINMNCQTDEGVEYRNFRFRQGAVPSFVKEDIAAYEPKLDEDF